MVAAAGGGGSRWAAGRQVGQRGDGGVDAMVLDGNDSAHTMWSAAGYTSQESWSRWVKPADA